MLSYHAQLEQSVLWIIMVPSWKSTVSLIIMVPSWKSTDLWVIMVPSWNCWLFYVLICYPTPVNIFPWGRHTFRHLIKNSISSLLVINPLSNVDWCQGCSWSSELALFEYPMAMFPTVLEVTFIYITIGIPEINTLLWLNIDSDWFAEENTRL